MIMAPVFGAVRSVRTVSKRLTLSLVAHLVLLTACATQAPPLTAGRHLSAEAIRPVRPDIPPLVPYPFPRPEPADETGRLPEFSIDVDGVPVRELLQALARDAGLDLDLAAPGDSRITLHAAQQPLPRLLQRIARQSALRIELDGRTLTVQPDTPVLRFYAVDYLNLQRQANAAVTTLTQITGAPAGLATTAGTTLGITGGMDTGNGLRIDNRSRHQFWEVLERNLRDLLRDTDRPLPEGASETRIEEESRQQGSQAIVTLPRGGRSHATPEPRIGVQPLAREQSSSTVIRRQTHEEAAPLIIHGESGILGVRATQRQHERVQEYLDRVLSAARRQVMIEATIVEVELNDGYRQGIDWQRLRADGSGFSVTRPADGMASDRSGGAFALRLQRSGGSLDLSAALDLLQSFGTARVLSSPRLSVLNNQTALLKVVENVVYFQVKADTTSSANVGTTTAVTTTPQAVSVGLVLAVTPQIDPHGSVMLNIRPSISSVADWKQDPNPSNTVANLVPQIRTREMESILRVQHGDIAVLGGLMEDGLRAQTSRVPGLGELPLAGELLTKRDNVRRKSELVIFLRPTVLGDARLTGDFAAYRDHLPGAEALHWPAHARPFALQTP